MAYREDYERATGRTRWREDSAFHTGGYVQNGPLACEGTVFGNLGDPTVFEFWENSTPSTDNKTNINPQNEFKAPMTEVDEFTKVQNLIAETCDEIKNLLLEKNRKYGNSALDPRRIFSKADAIEQIRVRIDDKLNRIAHQQSDEDEDVIQDLMGYLVLFRVANKLRELQGESATAAPDEDDELELEKLIERARKEAEKYRQRIVPATPTQPYTCRPWWDRNTPVYDGSATINSQGSDVEDEFNEYLLRRGEGELT